ncbi:P4 alpha zinc-binding domain-containing protein [Ensifer adhaerens]|uniref:primase-helicase zinc-binding domain-containing protein n=1 Tax=Ensifer adhaerens TaxID=106592 RepID=UPI0021016E28|nr:primase-helicase zinc-binding domain-containing protein [Ensifer adhaerens]UTV37628.1 P4 alpha zinc-binding domain-containing protein [Ensifer adhaerens]
MTTAIDLFVEEARGVSVVDAAISLGLVGSSFKGNHAGACPVCQGKDRFAISNIKGAWNCRNCGMGGKDGISLVAHAGHIDVRSRAGFLAACAQVLGKPLPDEAERETEEQIAERRQRIVAQKAKNEAAAADREKQDNAYRDREVKQSRGIFFNASAEPHPDVAAYLKVRTGYDMPGEVFAYLRSSARCTYWHGRDDRGHEIARHVGVAMVAPFVDLAGQVTGCHQTWIDMQCAPKFRPDLGRDDKGEPLQMKKMRGTKRGSLIPLFGLMSSTRWVGGEGIENGLSIAGAEQFRQDTFYFAAGDLGNLAGPAEPKSRFAHPELTKSDRNGRERRVMVAGPEPKIDQAPDEAMQVPDHVTQLVLLGDGDSEVVFTAAAMARAEKRLARDGRVIETWWPPEGMDFSALMTRY